MGPVLKSLRYKIVVLWGLIVCVYQTKLLCCGASSFVFTIQLSVVGDHLLCLRNKIVVLWGLIFCVYETKLLFWGLIFCVSAEKNNYQVILQFIR